jgi:hypothetical protein
MVMVLGLATTASAAVDFERDIQPLFATHCLSCHGPDEQKSGYRLDQREVALGDADFGVPSILPGDSAASTLIQFVSGTHEEKIVMPKGKGRRLSSEEIALLSEWIDAGASWPDHLAGGKTLNGEGHWLYQPVSAKTPPVHTSAWPSNAIDAFILERLKSAGLEPAPRADRVTLIKRLYLSMHGLPPTPQQVDHFVEDPRPDAFARVVEEVLDSLRYGERWAQHWLDVVRYADTHGFEVNTPRDTAWPYRDYVIRALNEDRPYDRFISEQLAGDEMGEDAATGFMVTAAVLLPGQIGKDDRSKRLARQDQLDEMVTNVSAAFMGLTVGCARCHNHKFDPITQKDYYALQGVFSGVSFGDREIQVDSETRTRFGKADAEIRDLKGQLTTLTGIRPAVSARKNVEHFPPTKARFVRFTINATMVNNRREPCIDELQVFSTAASNVALASAGATATASGEYNSGISASHKLKHINDGRYGNGRSWISERNGGGWVQIEFAKAETIDSIEWARDAEGKYADRLPVDYRIDVALEPGDWREVASSVNRLPLGANMLDKEVLAKAVPAATEREIVDALIARIETLTEKRAKKTTPVRVYGGVFMTPEPSFRLRRGDPDQPLEQLAPDTVSFLGSLELEKDAPGAERRLALAKWLAQPDNLLTSRVAVNRIWHHHFGTGIVDTPSDMGGLGGRPTHPELLDWLAAEFVAKGWSSKEMHRLILSSSTWQQSNRTQPKGLQVDADCRLLWRFPPRRLEGEAIRDSVLAVSGTLDLSMGGPGFSLFKPGKSGVAGYDAKDSFAPSDFRRMIYSYKVRMEQDSVFSALDIPDGGQPCSKRSSSTTPIQALNLFNSTFMLQQSEILAARVRKISPDTEAQARQVFQLALLRQPRADELPAAEDTIEAHGLQTLCRVMFNTNEFLFIP